LGELLGLLIVTIDDEIEVIFVEFFDIEDVESIRGCGEEVCECLCLLT